MVQLINLTEKQLKEIVAETVRQELETISTSSFQKDRYPKYYTRQETADRLRISLPTLNEYTKKGIIAGKRVGTRVLYTENAIQEALKKMYK